MQEQVCKNCGHHFTGKFCNNCGEKLYTSKDKSILHFLEEGLHFITHFEGKFFTTLKAILLKPGKLSLDYCNGARKKYFKPLSFFLLLVVLYLIFPLFVGLNMPFSFYLFEKQYAPGMITAKTGINIDSITHVINLEARAAGKEIAGDAFMYKVQKADQVINSHPQLYSLKNSYTLKAEKTSKLLLFILIPAAAIALFIFFFIKRRYFYDHLIMGTEVCCFYMIVSFFIVPLITMACYALFPSWSIANISESLIGYISMGILCIFCTMAFRRFYKVHWLAALPVAAIFVYGLNLFVWNIYKYLLFAITLKLSH